MSCPHGQGATEQNDKFEETVRPWPFDLIISQNFHATNAKKL